MDLRFEWKRELAAIDAAQWGRLADRLNTPFLEWEWLRQMEASGSIVPAAGWWPFHLTVWRGQHLVAAAPLYIKGNSSGEFVFDQVWADVARKLGLAYYPKLVGMIPVTPMEGYRFLMDPNEDEARLTRQMVFAIERLCTQNRLSGCHFLFADPLWAQHLKKNGYCAWHHHYYRWHNRDFYSFNDFLSVFKSGQRRNIIKERRKLEQLGLQMRRYTGRRIAREFLPTVYRLYEKTNDRFGPWGCKYLTPAFFEGLYAQYRHRLLLITAEENGHADATPNILAMAFLVHKADRLYGRYWGADKHIPLLHFDLCYYQPIEYAIEHGIRRFDPGIGGEHKERRGFTSDKSISLHRFFDPSMQMVMENHIDEINSLEQAYIDAANARVPFAAKFHPSPENDHS